MTSRMTLTLRRIAIVAGLAGATPASAKPAAPVAATLPAPVGLREIATFKPERGFIDDPVAVDAGGRLVFLETDASTFTTLVVVDDSAVRTRLPLGDAGDVPLTMALVGTGERAQVFIVQAGEDGRAHRVHVIGFKRSSDAHRIFPPLPPERPDPLRCKRRKQHAIMLAEVLDPARHPVPLEIRG